MNRLMRNILAVAVTIGLAAGAGWPQALAANGDVPVGIWQTTDRHMDYLVEYCGDGTQLCVRLTGLRGGVAEDPKVTPFLNSYIMKGAKPAGRNLWKGMVSMQGHSASGTITFVPGQKMVVAGCAYFVFCETFTLIPAP